MWAAWGYVAPSRTLTVLRRYQAALPDELDLRPGMRLRVLRLYDDAWGTAQVIGGGAAEMGRQGAFPIVSDLPGLICREAHIAIYSESEAPAALAPPAPPSLPVLR
jgi:hypothetical protein